MIQLRHCRLFLLYLLVGQVAAFATYDPSIGRFISEDPTQEQGGMNLYAANANNSVNNIDPLGNDFITIGTRAIPQDPTGLIGNHMSIEFWKESPCTRENTAITRNGSNYIIVDHSRGATTRTLGATLTQTIELLPDFSRYFMQLHAGRSGSILINQGVGVSEIFIAATDAADRLIVINSDADHPNAADNNWQKILSAARSYGYASYPPGAMTASNWPNSEYQVLGNNSNTFIRVMARVIGANADIIGGSHPGNTFPVPVQDNRPAPTWQ